MSEISMFRGFDFTDTDWADRNKDIAARLGCAPGVVAAARRHFGMGRPRIDWTSVDFDRPTKELARELGCCESSVVKARADAGLSRQRIDWTGVDWGKTNKAIAEEMGCAPITVAVARQRIMGSRAPKRGRQKSAENFVALSVRFSEDEYAEIGDAAEFLGISRGELVRRAIAEFMKNMKMADSRV